MKLTRHAYANANVRITINNDIYFVSYRTVILTVANDGWIIPNYAPNCSATTIKHVGWFMREYCAPLTYHDVKKAYYGKYKINYLTGEIEEL